MTRTPEERAAWAAKMKEYYRTHPEYAAKVRARSRQQHAEIMADPELRKKERARHRDKERRHRARRKAPDPIRRAARVAVSNAIRDGRLIKPKACQRCGNTQERIEAHHADYSKPLQVEWLCSLCHGTTRKR